MNRFVFGLISWSTLLLAVGCSSDRTVRSGDLEASVDGEMRVLVSTPLSKQPLMPEASVFSMITVEGQSPAFTLIGTEKQSEELVMYLLDGFENDPAKIWESNIFGKSLHELVNEGLHSKLYKMPADARMKLQETLERVINDGCSGLICFIL